MQVLYDFDGTITTKDTTILLLVELVKLRPLRFFRIIWYLIRIKFSRKSLFKQKYKNKAIGYLIKDFNDNKLNTALNIFKKKVKLIYRPPVMESINQAIKNDLKVIIMTASPTFAIRFCLSDLPVLVIGTEFEKKKNIYTGHLEGDNCYGPEKVNRLKKWAKLNNIELNIQSAWSDHFSDFDMLSLSAKRYWVGGEQLQKQVTSIDPDANFINIKNI